MGAAVAVAVSISGAATGRHGFQALLLPEDFEHDIRRLRLGSPCTPTPPMRFWPLITMRQPEVGLFGKLPSNGLAFLWLGALMLFLLLALELGGGGGLPRRLWRERAMHCLAMASVQERAHRLPAHT